MTTTIRLEHHFSRGSIAKALFAMFVLLIAFTFACSVLEHIYQKWSPTSWWYKYESVVPVKQAFASGDMLEFKSTVTRYAALSVRWEDTLYCKSDIDSEKYPTQYRPESVLSTEYKSPGQSSGVWKYGYKIETHEKSCMMCGTVIGTTELGYSKVYTYCTQEFSVNK